MSNVLDDYSNEVFQRQFQRLLEQLRRGFTTQKTPRGFLLGGQSGAGKTRLQKIIMNKYGYNFIVINGDEYRSLHPNFETIQKRYGIDAPTHTAKWAGQMVEALVEALSDTGYNLIVEGTLRTADVPLRTASMLREKGYSVSLALMAVKPDISLVSCQIRYEQMRIADTTPRAVDPAHHAKIVKDIAGNLAKLETSGLFDSVSLYNRAEVCLFAAKCPSPDNPASIVLHDILFGEWTEEEREHLAALQEQLDLLREAVES